MMKVRQVLASVCVGLFALLAVAPMAMAQTEAPAVKYDVAVEEKAQAVDEDFGEDMGEDAGGVENVEDYDLVYGAIKEVKADAVVISQFDEETEADVDVLYATDAETTFDGIGSLAELKAGEEVEIMFQDVEGKKAVRLLTRIADIYLDEEGDVSADLEAPAPEEQVIQSEEGAY